MTIATPDDQRVLREQTRDVLQAAYDRMRDGRGWVSGRYSVIDDAAPCGRRVCAQMAIDEASAAFSPGARGDAMLALNAGIMIERGTGECGWCGLPECRNLTCARDTITHWNDAQVYYTPVGAMFLGVIHDIEEEIEEDY